MNKSSTNDKTILLYVTCPDESIADKISNGLLTARLAACTNMIKGMKSTYRWEGKLESTQEVILIIKTRSELSEHCQRMVLELHPYTLPCIMELPIAGGHPAYLKWLFEETALGSTIT
jgi:periplasmic divalent cation tolerance protein